MFVAPGRGAVPPGRSIGGCGAVASPQDHGAGINLWILKVWLAWTKYVDEGRGKCNHLWNNVD
jgi:hypothetical protein